MKDKIKQLFSENGKLSGKKVLAVTLASTLVLGTGLFAFASTQTATDYNILGQTVHISSQGTIQYDNDNNGTPEVVIDADDIHNIASRLAQASAGMDNPTDTEGNPISDITILPNNKLVDASGAFLTGEPSFTKGMVGSLTVDTSHVPSDTPQYDSDGDGTPDSDYIMANADNLSKGKAAWAGNTLLLGTGADNENSYNSGYADGVRAGINNGRTAIVAHFHGTGDQTFVSDDTQTAYQKYQAYLGSHNTGENASSRYGCYQNYYSHTHSSSCYTVYHTHNDSCYRTEDYFPGATLTEVSPGNWCDVCNECGSRWGAGTCQCMHQRKVLICSRDTSAHLTCGMTAGTYYGKNCSYTNGQILEIKIIME